MGFISHTTTLGYRTGYGPMEWFGIYCFFSKGLSVLSSSSRILELLTSPADK